MRNRFSRSKKKLFSQISPSPLGMNNTTFPDNYLLQHTNVHYSHSPQQFQQPVSRPSQRFKRPQAPSQGTERPRCTALYAHTTICVPHHQPATNRTQTVQRPADEAPRTTAHCSADAWLDQIRSWFEQVQSGCCSAYDRNGEASVNVFQSSVLFSVALYTQTEPTLKQH